MLLEPRWNNLGWLEITGLLRELHIDSLDVRDRGFKTIQCKRVQRLGCYFLFEFVFSPNGGPSRFLVKEDDGKF